MQRSGCLMCRIIFLGLCSRGRTEPVWLGFLGVLLILFSQTVQFLIDTTGGAEAEGAMMYPVVRLPSPSSMTTDTFTTTAVKTLAVPLWEIPSPLGWMTDLGLGSPEYNSDAVTKHPCGSEAL